MRSQNDAVDSSPKRIALGPKLPYNENMSDRLRLAFDEAAKLPKEEQDAFAAFLLAELEDEKLWQKQFAASQGALAKLAAKARREQSLGKTRPLEDLLK